jgi:hypothetical protein
LVTISGYNFTGATQVAFNGVAAASPQIDSDTQIRANVPTGATTGKISVTTPIATVASYYDFYLPPAISSFTPASGPFGAQVTITGINFTGATTQVDFNGVAATDWSVESNTQISAKVPVGATTGPITVTTPGGTAMSASNFIVTSPPVKSFVFLANKVTLKRTKQVTPGGDIHSNGTLTVEKGAPSTYNSNLTAVGAITIKKDNTINGNVTSATAISNQGTINGAATVGPVDTESLPSKSYSAGGSNVTVPSGGTLALAPGSYGIVTLNSSGTLQLTSGDYYMDELRYPGSKAVIEIDLNSGIAMTVNVVSNLQLGKEVEIRLLPNGEADSKLVAFNTLQSSQVDVGKEAYFLGALNAPNAKVVLKKNSQLRGAICANEIVVERDCLFLHHDSPGSLPGPGNLPKSSESEESEVSESEVVASYELAQNYPNPFNPSTVISFQLPVDSEASLKIYNLNGQLVKLLVAGKLEAGRHKVVWDGKNEAGVPVASGVYVYVLKAGDFTAQRKLVLMK